MKCMIFQSNVLVNKLKEVVNILKTWISSFVSQVEEAESTEQKYKGMESEKIDLGNITCE